MLRNVSPVKLYFGLRDYGTAQWDGGDSACDHKEPAPGPTQNKANNNREGTPYRSVCRKCGAVRVDQQIGLEGTLADYIDTLVAVFREVRRVLHPTGTCWLNLGDSYAGSGKGAWDRTDVQKEVYVPKPGGLEASMQKVPEGLKAKDLMMVPARVAIALQDDGWWLRSDIIWAKKNCMPESVSDRPTSSHEHIFLLTKQTKYFYDAEAVKEISEQPDRVRSDVVGGKNGHTVRHSPGGTYKQDGVGNPTYTGFNGRVPAAIEANGYPPTRNQRNVWHLATEPFPDAHFATFPTEIPRRCIKAGTSERGCCSACGAPWRRVVERTGEVKRRWSANDTPIEADNWRKDNGRDTQGVYSTTGWQPGCSCDAGPPIPQTVLDIFGGSGTTGLVADQLGRNAILIELNPEYAEMSRQRIYNDAPLFVDIAAD